MPSIYPKLRTARVSPVKSSKRSYSTDSKGAQLVKLSLKCGATMRAILSADLGAITSSDVDDLNHYFGDREGKPIIENIQFDGLTFVGDRGRVLGALVSCACLGVRRLNLNQLNMDKETVRSLVKGISRAPNLERVNITQSGLRDRDLGPILTAVSQNPKVTVLVLDQNIFSGPGCEALTKITGNLHALSLSGNFAGPESAPYVSKLLQANRNLSELDLSRNQLRATGIDSLAPAFIFNHALLSLNLSGNEISPAGCIRLCQCLQDNSGLRHLNLAFNHIGDQGVEALCKLLSANRTLQTVQLDMNRLTSQSGRLIGDMLKKNTTLKSISLDSNLLLGTGASALANALPYNDHLEHLSLSDNEIGNEGIQAFAHTLPKNLVLQRLVLTHARVQDPTIYRSLVTALESNTTLKMLDSDFDFVGWEAIYQSLQPLLTRNYLLHRNQISSATRVLFGVRALCSSDTWGCPLPPELLEEIVLQLDSARSLHSSQIRRIFRAGRCFRTLTPEFTLEVFLEEVFGSKFRLQPCHPTFPSLFGPAHP